MRPELSQEGARSAAWCACVVSTVGAFALLRATHTGLKTGSLLVMAGLVLGVAILHVIYTRLRPEPRIGAVAGGVAVVLWAGTTVGVTALAALRTGAPLIDTALAHADAVLGLDTPALVAWVAKHPSMGRVLDIIYWSAGPLVLADILLLACLRCSDRMWQACFVFAASATFCAWVSAVLPAVGAFTYHGVPPDVLAALPNGAGRFHLGMFDGYRSGILDTVDVRHLQGVVTFPSFHAVVALLTAYAVRDLRWLSGPAWAWSGLLIVSTIPIGGHYAVDLMAGAGVWAAFTLLSEFAFRLRPHAAAGTRRIPETIT